MIMGNVNLAQILLLNSFFQNFKLNKNISITRSKLDSELESIWVEEKIKK